jgi:hypothetical protein
VGAITERATQMAQQLEAANINATINVREVNFPAVLVVPVPSYDFTEATLAGGFQLTWTLWALVKGIGDLKAAEDLEDLVAGVVDVLDIDTAVADTYRLPGASDPLPAYKLTVTETT